MSPSKHEQKDKAITINNSTASERECHLSTKGKDSVRWIGGDKAYEVRFLNADWAFKPDAKRKDANYSYVDVEHGKETHKYKLDYELEDGQTRKHPYDILIPGTTGGAGGGPNGPTIIGEG